MILPMRFASFVFTFMLFVIWGIANGNTTIHALHCLAACTCLLKLTACFDFLLSRPTLPVWVRWITLNVVLLYSFTSKTKLKRVDQNIKLAFKSCILIYRILYPRRLLIKVLYGEAPPWGPTPYVPLSHTFHWKMVLKKTPRITGLSLPTCSCTLPLTKEKWRRELPLSVFPLSRGGCGYT